MNEDMFFVFICCFKRGWLELLIIGLLFLLNKMLF